jgi:O-antigen/teichoic acid export membrane protein
MQFDRVAMVTLAASAVGVSVTIALAFMDYGPNSMAIGAVVGNLVTGVGAWIARSGRNVLRPSLSEWRAVVKFGGQSSLTGIVTSISMDANDLVVGKVLGFHPVAILSRAQGLMNLFHRDLMAAVRGVALPAYAAAHRHSEDVEVQHARSMAIVTVFAWPFYGLVSLYSLEVLRLLFGPQWDEAATLVPIYCIAGAISAVTALVPTLLLALGRIDLVTRAEMLLQPSRFVLIALAAIVFRSVEACALAYLVITFATLPVFLRAKQLAIKRTSLELHYYLLPSLGVTIVALLPAILHVGLSGFGRTEPLALQLVILSCTLAVFGWVGAALWLNHPIAKEPLFLRCIDLLAWRNKH